MTQKILKKCTKLKKFIFTPATSFHTWINVFNDPDVNKNFATIEKFTMNLHNKEPNLDLEEQALPGQIKQDSIVNRNHPSTNLINDANKLLQQMIQCKDVFSTKFPRLKVF